MTREEAKLERLEYNSGSDVYNRGIKAANRKASFIINKIYDDFESRTCESCKYLEVSPDGGNTDAVERFCNELIGHVDEGFGCNHWSQK